MKTKTMKDIDTAPRLDKLMQDIYMKIVDQVEMNLRQKINIILDVNDEVDRLRDIQVGLINFFISSHED
jgi:hypothetical protein